LDKLLLPEFGSRKVAGITPELVQRYINRLSKEGYAPGTVRGTYAVLRNALNAGVRLKMIAVNPCQGVKAPAPIQGGDAVGRVRKSLALVLEDEGDQGREEVRELQPA
jgi:site-specific recombinase XerC